MAKKRICQEVLKYTAVFEPAKEGGFVASVPALPGCATQGETFEDAVKMVQDAIMGYLEVLNEDKQEIPTERGEAVVTKIEVPFPYRFAV